MLHGAPLLRMRNELVEMAVSAAELQYRTPPPLRKTPGVVAPLAQGNL